MPRLIPRWFVCYKENSGIFWNILAFSIMMVHTYGMVVMEHRTTFALDDLTIQKMRHLAKRWKVSQAEVVRRAIEQAERLAEQEKTQILDRLVAYQQKGALSARQAQSYMEEVAENRAEWGRGE